MKYKILAVAAMAATAGSASALTVNPDSSVRFSFAGVDDATIGYPRQATPGPVCTTGLSCDGVAAFDSQNGEQLLVDGDNDGQVDDLVGEDTWGVARVNAVSNASGSENFFSNGSGGEFISLFFYGLYDHTVIHNSTSVSGNSASFTTFSRGGFLDVWSDDVDFNFGGSGNSASAPGGQTARTGLSTYDGDNNPATDNSPTDGELLLRLAFAEFDPDGAGSDPSRTLSGTFSDTDIGGGSTAFFDVAGGSLANIFDTNTRLDGAGGLHDFSLAVSFQCADQGVECDLTNTDPDLFTVLFTGDFIGRSAAAVPVPASMLLMLAGVGAMVRRRK